MRPRLEDVPRPAFWKKLILGTALVVVATASATSVAAFHELDRLRDIIGTNPSIDVPRGSIDPADHGEPRTFLLLGSDKRPEGTRDGSAGTGARSDTIILARLDPDGEATTLLSLPRDLRVRIPGRGTAKLNEAYERGGPGLTLQTVRRVLRIPVNHVINVDFKGFEAAINAIGCIYVDVDRRYFNDTAEYAYINVPQGYQRLCGRQALEYARFRHEDTDLVRGIRQQEVIRATKQQAGVRNLVGSREKLQRIVGRYTTSDARLKDRKTLLEVLKLTAGSAGRPIRHIPFRGSVGPTFVTASDRSLQQLGRRLQGDVPDPRPPARRKGARSRSPGLERAPGPGKDQALQAIQQGAGGQLPVYYPTARLKRSLFTGPPRYYKIRTPGRRFHKAYRMVMKRNRLGEYYGIQGTTWKNPPLLEGDFDEVEAGKRIFEVHYDGDRVKLVAWRTKKAVYWVSNTLLQSLNKEQMLAIARTTRLP